MKDRAQREFKQRRARARGRSRRGWPRLPGDGPPQDRGQANAVVNVGWGRLIFAETFETAEGLADVMRQEAPDERDITINVNNPHVVLAQAPEAFFLDPSHTFRLEFEHYRPRTDRLVGVYVRRLRSSADADAVNRIYAKVGMVPVGRDFLLAHRGSRRTTRPPIRSSAPSPASITSGSMTIRRAARACGAWRSIRRRRFRGSARCCCAT